MQRYDKLVRDRIPDIIRAKGGNPVTHVATPEEYWQKLVQKLVEEVQEFKENPGPEELADVCQVLEAIFEHQELAKENGGSGWDKTNVTVYQRKKANERGLFDHRIILEEA